MTSLQIVNFDISVHSPEADTNSVTNQNASYIVTAAYRSRLAHGVLMEDSRSPIWQEPLQVLSTKYARLGHDAITGLGTQLFQTLMHGEVRDLWLQARAEYESNVIDGLRIRFAIQPPAVASLPWEALYDPDRQELFATRDTICLLRSEWAHRHVGASHSMKTTMPLRILLVVPDEPDELQVTQPGAIDAAQEVAAVQSAVQAVGPRYCQLHIQTGRIDALQIQQALAEHTPAILHIIGHGTADGLLLWQDQQPRLMPASTLRIMLQHALGVKLVLLNACSTARITERGTFSTIAPQLLQAGIPAVVAMQYDIDDRIAAFFAQQFYSSLLSPKGWGAVDRAISFARRSLYAREPQGFHFGVPILWLNADDGQILDLPTDAQSLSTSHSDTRAPTPQEMGAQFQDEPTKPPPAKIRESINEEAAHLRHQIDQVEQWLWALKPVTPVNADAQLRQLMAHRNREVEHLHQVLQQLYRIEELGPQEQQSAYQQKMGEVLHLRETITKLDELLKPHLG